MASFTIRVTAEIGKEFKEWFKWYFHWYNDFETIRFPGTSFCGFMTPDEDFTFSTERKKELNWAWGSLSQDDKESFGEILRITADQWKSSFYDPYIKQTKLLRPFYPKLWYFKLTKENKKDFDEWFHHHFSHRLSHYHTQVRLDGSLDWFSYYIDSSDKKPNWIWLKEPEHDDYVISEETWRTQFWNMYLLEIAKKRSHEHKLPRSKEIQFALIKEGISGFFNEWSITKWSRTVKYIGTNKKGYPMLSIKPNSLYPPDEKIADVVSGGVLRENELTIEDYVRHILKDYSRIHKGTPYDEFSVEIINEQTNTPGAKRGEPVYFYIEGPDYEFKNEWVGRYDTYTVNYFGLSRINRKRLFKIEKNPGWNPHTIALEEYDYKVEDVINEMFFPLVKSYPNWQVFPLREVEFNDHIKKEQSTNDIDYPARIIRITNGPAYNFPEGWKTKYYVCDIEYLGLSRINNDRLFKITRRSIYDARIMTEPLSFSISEILKHSFYFITKDFTTAWEWESIKELEDSFPKPSKWISSVKLNTIAESVDDIMKTPTSIGPNPDEELKRKNRRRLI